MNSEVLEDQKSKWFCVVPFLATWLDFRRQQGILRKRSEDLVCKAWDGYGVPFSEVKPLCEAIANGGGWDSYRFLPNDKTATLFFPDGDMGFESIAILRELENSSFDAEKILELLESSPSLLLGELVRELRSRSYVDTNPR
jgi:hypothetical protein